MKNLFLKKKAKKTLLSSKEYFIYIFSGFLLFLSFPKFDLFFLPWIALAPVLISLYDKSENFSFKAGLALGMVYFFGTTYWIYHALHVYGSFPLLISIVVVLILSLYLSLYPAVFCWLYCIAIKKTTLPALLVAPCLWTSLEFIRSYAFTGFPWSSLGYSQYNFLPLIQFADITGIYGVSFIILSFNGLIADIYFFKRIRMEKPLYSSMSLITGFICFAIILVLIFSYGLYRLYEDREGTTVKAAIVQGNIDQDKKWNISYQKSVLHTYKSLTLKTLSESPDLIIWPETALPFSFNDDKMLTDELVNFQKELGSYMLFGSILVKKEEKKLSNSAVLLDKNGKVSYIYDKIHLVPFGEYVPVRKILFFIDKLVYGVGDYHPGDSYHKAVTPFGSFATLICYEIIFPGMVRKFFLKDGDFIVTITNDAWFGATNGPYQHFSMAVFRAIENRKPVLRAANSGISGYIDSNGRILSKTELFDRTYSISELKKDSTKTIYTRFGDIFAYLCIVISVTIYISFQKKF